MTQNLQLQMDGLTLHVHGTGEKIDTLVYLHGDQELLDYLVEDLKVQMQEATTVALVAIEGEDWNRDLSPWESPKVFKKGEDFAGGADFYLNRLCGKVIPSVENRLAATPQRRILLGYSLAGLFAVYAQYRTTLFSSVGSVSGSLWFDGFLEYVEEQSAGIFQEKKPERVYFSLGDRERMTHNPRMCRVEDCTRSIWHKLQEHGIRTVFELNPGNHFHQVNERMARALRWLLEKE